MRVLCHAQHLSGVGHWVRMHAIASGLAAAGHEVHLVDGGRPVPRVPVPSAVRLLPLPRLVRVGGRLAALDASRPLDAVLADRVRALAAAVRAIRPDVLLVDHYPFSKWELEREIAAAVAAARDGDPRARIVCSLRDIVPRTRHEADVGAGYEAVVLDRLRAHFDAVLVHGDRAFACLGEHFVAADRLPLPVAHTGFVTAASPRRRTASSAPYAVLSCGGGGAARSFLETCVEAFRGLVARGGVGRMRLRVFAGLALGQDDGRALAEALGGGPIDAVDFSAEFGEALAGSALSIGRAGYNTTVELLAARVRAVVVPDPRMSDQGPRARRLATLGLATVVEDDPPRPAALAAAMERALAAPPPRHDFALDGVATTVRLLEAVGSGREVAWDSTPTSTSRSTPA